MKATVHKFKMADIVDKENNPAMINIVLENVHSWFHGPVADRTIIQTGSMQIPVKETVEEIEEIFNKFNKGELNE